MKLRAWKTKVMDFVRVGNVKTPEEKMGVVRKIQKYRSFQDLELDNGRRFVFRR